MLVDRRRPAQDPEALVSQYWDALVHGQDSRALPEHASTIHQLYERARTPHPAPDFAAELEAHLMHAAALTNSSSPPLRLQDARQMDPFRPASSVPRGPRTRHDIDGNAVRMVAAAVLLLAIIGSAVAGSLIPRLQHAMTQPPQLPSLEAIQETATPTPTSPQMTVIAHEIWEASENKGAPLHDPFGIGIDRQGNVWVANERSNDFAIYSADGKFIETWGTPGAANGQFASPEDVAFAPDGTFYVSDAGNHRVQQFAPDRSFVRSWSDAGNKSGPLATAETAEHLGHPIMIKVAPDGTIYVSDDERNVIERYSRDGEWLNSLGSGILAGPGGVAFAADGSVWVADYGHELLQVFRPDGTLLRTAGIPGTSAHRLNVPNALAFDDAGRLYVPTSTIVEVFDPSLRLLGHSRRSEGGYSSQVEIELGPNGRIYTTDYMLGLLSAFDLDTDVPPAAADAPALLVEDASSGTPVAAQGAKMASSPLLNIEIPAGDLLGQCACSTDR